MGENLSQKRYIIRVRKSDHELYNSVINPFAPEIPNKGDTLAISDRNESEIEYSVTDVVFTAKINSFGNEKPFDRSIMWLVKEN